MRQFITVFDSTTGETSIAFRDPDDYFNHYAIDTDIPSMKNVERIAEICRLLNQDQHRLDDLNHR